jgi:hypothetical protein
MALENAASEIVQSLNVNADESENQALTENVTEESSEAVQNDNTEASNNSESAKLSSEFNKKFAALSKREKEVRQRESEYDRRISELEAKLTAKQEPVIEVKEELPLEYRLKRNPLNTLKELGIGYDKLTELMLSEKDVTPEMQLSILQEDLDKKYEEKFGKQIKELEAKLSAKEEAEKQKELDAVINQFQSEINNEVNSDPDKYELVLANNAQQLIFDVIDQHYQQTQRILPVKDAADAVEEHLYQEASKLTKLKKLQIKEQSTKTNEPLNAQSSKTLSNALSAQVPKNADSKLSDDDSKAKAAQLLKWDV